MLAYGKSYRRSEETVYKERLDLDVSSLCPVEAPGCSWRLSRIIYERVETLYTCAIEREMNSQAYSFLTFS